MQTSDDIVLCIRHGHLPGTESPGARSYFGRQQSSECLRCQCIGQEHLGCAQRWPAYLYMCACHAVLNTQATAMISVTKDCVFSSAG